MRRSHRIVVENTRITRFDSVYTHYLKITYKKGKRAMRLKEFEKKTGIHITVNHTGKMDGMASLSTSVLLNPMCQARARVSDSVCSRCYASRMASMYKGLEKVLAKNTEILTTRVIPVKDWPTLNYRVFRFEAFGDLNNSIQVQNYFNFARKNPHTKFALWTKNPELVAVAVRDGHKVPRNLIIIQSSNHLNAENEPRFAFVDKVFTVYEKSVVEFLGVTINCGARNCLECGRCYRKSRTVEHVNELLK